MTDQPESIARLRELMKNADPLPWSTVNDSEEGEAEIYCHWHEVGPLSLKGKSINANSKLVHAAVNALPDLLAILESRATAPVVVDDAMVDRYCAHRWGNSWNLGWPDDLTKLRAYARSGLIAALGLVDVPQDGVKE